MLEKIYLLSEELRIARDSEAKLRIQNQQLTAMVASSNRADLRKTKEFIGRVEDIVERKIRIENGKADNLGFKCKKRTISNGASTHAKSSQPSSYSSKQIS